MKYTHYILILVTMLATDMTCSGNTNNTVDPGGKGRGSGNQSSSANSEEEKILRPYFTNSNDLALVTNRQNGIAKDVCKLFQDEPLEKEAKEALWERAFTVKLSDQGCATLVGKLIEAGVDPNKHLGNITASICDGYEKTFKAVVDSQKLDLSKEYNGETLLATASCSEKLDCVKILLQAGAKPDFKSMEWACHMGNVTILKALIEKLDKKMLLDKLIISSLDARAYQTLLYKAVSEGHEAIVKALLEAGADHNKGRIVEGATKTPLALAKEKGNQEIIKLLKEKGAQ